MTQVDDVLRQITRLQSERGYSDSEMAARIGCSRPLYQRTRTGRIPVGGTFLKGAMQLLAADEKPVNASRQASLARQTGETDINITLDIDGRGRYEMKTGTPILDHLLSAFARHGLFDINIRASGDDIHHIAEDVAITLGQAFLRALGERRGIVRMADRTVPMDEALAFVAVDIGGRGYAVLDLAFDDNDMPGLPADLIRHFLESFAQEARLNLHARILGGRNDHHRAEALFKALGRALDAATRIDERLRGELPSTKGFLEG